MLRSLTLLWLALLLGCGGDTASSGDPTQVTYDPKLNVDLNAMERRESGLYVQDLQVGTGTEATRGRSATVHYEGWLPDGTLFDSSRYRQKTFAFTLGVGAVIAGWDEGVAGMKVGGKRKLVIPSKLGYGEQDNGTIPPNSVLIFDVELISVP
jgi:FKBP-type peptidyl-prolyl cis-trans isomerase